MFHFNSDGAGQNVYDELISTAATAAVAGYKRYQDEGEHKEEFILNGLLWKIVGIDWWYARENVYGKITGV
jgi:hypothetical protein